jgi:hypothetical protein
MVPGFSEIKGQGLGEEAVFIVLSLQPCTLVE